MTSNRNKKENSNLQESIFKDWILELIDDVTCGLCFEIHRAAKMGTLFLNEGDPETQKKFEIVDKKGFDIFGQVPAKKQVDCICPSCARTLAASRFAPHLEKCLGMGRNSSRIASKRIATNTSKRTSDKESETDNEKYDDDTDNYRPDRKTRRKEKHKKKHSKMATSKPSSISGSTSSVRSPSSSITYVDDLATDI